MRSVWLGQINAAGGTFMLGEASRMNNLLTESVNYPVWKTPAQCRRRLFRLWLSQIALRRLLDVNGAITSLFLTVMFPGVLAFMELASRPAEDTKFRTDFTGNPALETLYRLYRQHCPPSP